MHHLTGESSLDESDHESDIYSPPTSTVSDNSSIQGASDVELTNFTLDDHLELEEDEDEDEDEDEGNTMPVTARVPDIVDSDSESRSQPVPVSDLDQQQLEDVQITKKKVVRIQVARSACNLSRYVTVTY